MVEVEEVEVMTNEEEAQTKYLILKSPFLKGLFLVIDLFVNEFYKNILFSYRRFLFSFLC